jgi:hypothetical protein
VKTVTFNPATHAIVPVELTEEMLLAITPASDGTFKACNTWSICSHYDDLCEAIDLTHVQMQKCPKIKHAHVRFVIAKTDVCSSEPKLFPHISV